MLPVLLRAFKESSQVDKSNHLLAVSHLITHIPKSVLLGELNTILPLVIQSMSSRSARLLESTIKTLSILVVDAPAAVAQHLHSLVPQLLALTRFQESMQIRIASLECLSSLAFLPYHKIYPHKDRIANELKDALDDKKRAVRRAAVKCRNKWFVLKE